MRIPGRPNPGDQAHQALIGKAFAAHSGQTTDQAPHEQKEDELLHTIDSSLDAAKAAVEELKAGQEQEETHPDHDELGHEETGSPSAQGWP